MTTTVHLIQGFFFQPTDITNPILSDIGASERYMYSGIIFPDLNVPSGFGGKLTDHFGESSLFEIEFTPDSLRFTKRYDQPSRTDYIVYELTRTGNIWVGTYDGVMVGKGPTKCIVTQTTEEEILLP